MKRTLLATLTTLAFALTMHAEDCAVVTLKVGREKRVQQFAIEFYDGDAPATAENFRKLARKGYYNGTAIHRAFASTMLQMGDPLSKSKDRSKVGTGGPGYSLQPEIRRRHTRGAIAAARLPDKLNPSRVSNGSQFFVCLRAMPEYDGQYTVFGQVLWGLEDLEALSTRSTDSNDYPAERIEVKSIKVMDRSKLPAPPAPPAAGEKPKRAWWQIFG